MITHIVFDFFGTLVEYTASRTKQGYPRSHVLLSAAGARLDYTGFLHLWEPVSAEFERRADASLTEYSMQAVAQAFLARCVPAADDQLVQRFITTYLAEWNSGVRYVDGLPAMLDVLDRLRQRYTLAVITNTHDHTLVPDHLAAMGVDSAFQTVVTSVGHGRRKPSADIFVHTVQQLGTAPEACVYLGDNLHADYHGARAAGLGGVLIDPGGDAPIEAAHRLTHILELEAWLGN